VTEPEEDQVRRCVDELLAEARAVLVRLGPRETFEAQRRGALLVDIRSDDQIRLDGRIPGAIRIPRNVLEWRADPACDHCDPRIADLHAHLILVCQHGYQSSLAAANLQQLGFARATDLDGGFEAWQLAGLPVLHCDVA
jgi:rhodanese-related sulfurtransferase